MKKYKSFIIIVLFISLKSNAQVQNNYKAIENNSLLNLKTPQGPVFYFSEKNFSQMDSYRAEISYADIEKNFPQNNGHSPNDKSNKTDAADSASNIGSVDEVLVAANKHYNEGKFEKSLSYVEEILKRRPQHLRAWIMRGSLYRILGFKEQALESYKKASELDSKNEELKNIIRNMK
jgi:tetratricopeptide (TPR) repeat protein